MIRAILLLSVLGIVTYESWRYVGATLVPPGRTRIQLCGRLIVELGGRRVESALAGRQARLVFAFLALNRLRPVNRDELVEALWEEHAPSAAEVAVRALLSKLRAVLGTEVLQGRSDLHLLLPRDAWIDYEAAFEAIHRAEADVARSEWHDAWWPSRIALNISRREFLPGIDGTWVSERRRALEDVGVRAHECVAGIGLGIGGSELASAERSARALIESAPFHESGYRFLMQTMAARGNVAEALLVYDGLLRLLRDELGAFPSTSTQALHRQLLQRTDDDTGRRALRAVLFIDMVGSTARVAELGDQPWRELVARYQALIRLDVEQFGGREVDATGDGFFAMFESPGDAIRAAVSVITALRSLQIVIRAGVHFGECELVDNRVVGIAVHVGARVAEAARPSEVLVSSTVRDLVAGAGFEFEDRGVHTLKGIPGEWRLHKVRPDSAPRSSSDLGLERVPATPQQTREGR
jgi:SARP family transcriptional regulator, regulator of embCAB operon